MKEANPGLFCTYGYLALALAVSVAKAELYEPPADYYASISGNTATLKAELHVIISDNYWTSLTGPGGSFLPNGSGHRVHSYDDLREALPVVDRDPGHPANVILAYNGASVQGAWSTGGTIWNREHRWPDSWGLNSSGPDYSDMHQLTPCNPAINSSRGNSPFGTVSSAGGYASSGGYWYPGDNDAPDSDFGNDTGDAARVLFYMAVRYDGAESSTMDLEVRNGTEGLVGNMYYGGDLASALKWHYRDVPSTHERRRNHLIFSSADNPTWYQGNRNPFADRPEFVWTIFGDGANDSKLYFGDTPPADGASTLTIDLGSVTVGAPVPGLQPATLHKAGADPTYYAVSVSGPAVASVTGRYNSFEAGAGGRVVTLGLDPSATSTAGLKTGTVTVDNLELSNESGGTGSQDGDDVVTIQLMVCEIFPLDPDGDCDVDQDDLVVLQGCMSGAKIPLAVSCGGFDRDGDGDVDPDDYGVFQRCMSGPDIPFDANCDL
jgi:endonuclease I